MAHLLRTVLRLQVAGPSARSLYCRPYSTARATASAGASSRPTGEGLPSLESPLPDGINLRKKGLALNDNDRGILYTLLRDSCKCPACVDQHSKQRNFRTTDIPDDIQPRSIKWDGKNMEIQWASDIKGYDASHTSVYSKRALTHPVAIARRGDGGLSRKRMLWDRKSMQQVQHWISYDEYVNDDAKFATAMRQLALTGLIFVKDIPDSREMVKQVATRMGPLRNTFYGETWDVRSVPQAKNVAYTNVFLGFHMDLMYMNEPPGFQLLHCLENSCDGGESLFVDGFEIARQLARRNPALHKSLTQLRLNYEYNHNEHKYNNMWPVFEVDPVAQDQLLHVNYSPPFQGPLHHYHHNPEFLQPKLNALRQFTELLEWDANTFELKLNPGECVIFENRRVLHARRQFNTNSGKRWLAGAYVDEDALLSRFNVTRANESEAWYTVPANMAEHMRARAEAKRSKKAAPREP